MALYNFAPGPAQLPRDVVRELQTEAFDFYQGMSVLELSHRHPKIIEMFEATEQALRDLLKIPAHYKVLFTTGGARTQFSMVPLNLARPQEKCAYLITGHWSQFAYQAAQQYTTPYILSTYQNQSAAYVPPLDWPHAQGAYLHYTDNETVNGVECPRPPETALPLVTDMTSNLLTKPLMVERFGLIYAAAQKNLGIAGITLVILNPDILPTTAQAVTPPLYDYRLLIKTKSTYNTPPVVNWYVCQRMLAWIQAQGGLEVMYQKNQAKAKQLYDDLDAEAFYHNVVPREIRSCVNIPFQLARPELTDKFCEMATLEGLYHLKGHPLVGGLRANIYNAMPMQGVAALLDFMQLFVKTYG